jgi:hypothetical protein
MMTAGRRFSFFPWLSRISAQTIRPWCRATTVFLRPYQGRSISPQKYSSGGRCFFASLLRRSCVNRASAVPFFFGAPFLLRPLATRPFVAGFRAAFFNDLFFAISDSCQ